MLERGAMFMRCVETRTPPVALAPAALPTVEASKVYDMSGEEAWVRYAHVWVQCCGAAESAKKCERELKALMPADAKLAHGAGIRITRDRAGRVSLREGTQ